MTAAGGAGAAAPQPFVAVAAPAPAGDPHPAPRINAQPGAAMQERAGLESAMRGTGCARGRPARVKARGREADQKSNGRRKTSHAKTYKATPNITRYAAPLIASTITFQKGAFSRKKMAFPSSDSSRLSSFGRNLSRNFEYLRFMKELYHDG